MMELRKRKRYRRPNSIRRSGKQAPYPAYALAVLVFLAIAYAIGASKAGSYVAEHWLAPAMARLAADGEKATPAASATPTPTVLSVVTAEETREVELSEASWHAIQIGVYASEENAAAQAAALQKVGAAGYAVADDERYRVLASCYETEAEAQSVQSRLATEHVDSRLYVFAALGRRISVTAETAKTREISAAFEEARKLLQEFYALVLRFDVETMEAENAVPVLHTLSQTAENCREALRTAPGEDAAAFASFYADASGKFSEILAETDRIACAAKLKYGYLFLVDAYCRIVNA